MSSVEFRASAMLERAMAEFGDRSIFSSEEVVALVSLGMTEEEFMEESGRITASERLNEIELEVYQQDVSKAQGLWARLQQDNNACEGVSEDSVRLLILSGWDYERIATACRWKRDCQSLLAQLRHDFGLCASVTEHLISVWRVQNVNKGEIVSRYCAAFDDTDYQRRAGRLLQRLVPEFGSDVAIAKIYERIAAKQTDDAIVEWYRKTR